MQYILTIRPGIPPKYRHRIEDVLEELRYHVTGGGTHMDMSSSDIQFEDDVQSKET